LRARKVSDPSREVRATLSAAFVSLANRKFLLFLQKHADFASNYRAIHELSYKKPTK
jgi:hypothetical protein